MLDCSAAMYSKYVGWGSAYMVCWETGNEWVITARPRIGKLCRFSFGWNIKDFLFL